MLSFLNPWLWLGVIAVGAPLWLHLRRKDREKIICFSALRFLEDQPVAKQSPLQLQNILLFLLRLLAVLFFVAAFARPYFQENNAPVSSSQVYILDNTLSRQAEGGLDHDRNVLLKEISLSGPRDQIAVVEMADEPRVIVGFGDNPAQATAKLNALEPTSERGSMLAALRQADFLLKQSIGEHKHITILSDHQENQWLENSNTPPFLAPGMVTLSPFSGIPTRPNFYVCAPKLQRVFLGNNALMQFTAQVGHTGKVTTAVIKIISNGQEIVNQQGGLDEKTPQVGVVAKWEADPSVWLQGTISVQAQPDDLPQDNTAYFTFPPVTEGRVALLSESVYLQMALSEAVSKGHWRAEIIQPAKVSEAINAPPEKDADVLMIDANYLQSSQARALVHRYLHEGRGVFIMVGHLSTLLTGFLEEMGFQARLQDDGAQPKLEPIRYFASESPIFLPFKVVDFSNLLEVRIGTNVHLDSKGGKPLMFSQQGTGLLFEGTRDKGRFLLSTFAFDRGQTDWVVHPSFVPFLDSALSFLRPQANLNNMLEPGQIWAAQIPSDLEVKEVVLRADGKPVGPHVPVVEHRVNIRAPGKPGLYQLTYDDNPAVQQMLAVNPSEKESELKYLQTDPDMLKAWTISGPVENHKQAAPVLTPSLALASQQILWWKLLLAGMAALFLEMVVLTKRGQAA